MSSLFSDMPAPAADKVVHESEETAQSPNKRQKLDSSSHSAPSRPAGHFLSDPVVAALVKITTHISSSKKFNKASELLRQLVVGDKLGQEHSKLVFEVHMCP